MLVPMVFFAFVLHSLVLAVADHLAVVAAVGIHSIMVVAVVVEAHLVAVVAA